MIFKGILASNFKGKSEGRRIQVEKEKATRKMIQVIPKTKNIFKLFYRGKMLGVVKPITKIANVAEHSDEDDCSAFMDRNKGIHVKNDEYCC